MSKSPGIGSFVGLASLATLLTAIFPLLGAPFLRVFHNTFGSARYWASAALLLVILFQMQMGGLAAYIICFWVTIGVFGELEKRGRPGVNSAALSVFLGALSFAALYGTRNLADFQANMRQQLESVATSAGAGLEKGTTDLTIDRIVEILPSIGVVMLVFALLTALIFAHRIAPVLRLQFVHRVGRISLLEFRLPDWMIWPTLLALLFVALRVQDESIQLIAANSLHVFFWAYFLQGIAVTESAMSTFRAGFLARFLVYFVLIGNLLPFVAVIGFSDFWIEYRHRIKKWNSTRKQQNGESL